MNIPRMLRLDVKPHEVKLKARVLDPRFPAFVLDFISCKHAA